MNFKKYKHRSLAWLPLFSFALLLAAPGRADVWLIDVKGTIGPASADHMVRGLAAAQQNAAELVVLRIDTPGGLDLSMREMIKAILAAQVPVVGYVAPSGARAASAGTYLLYATQIAAMAPGTNLGAATPIQLGAPAVPQMPDAPAEEPAADGPYQGTAMERKVVNDAVAYIQSLAQLRGRNAQWAEKAVREGASLSAADALELGVIDILAPSLPDLLEQLDGREVEVGGAARILQLHGVQTYQHPVDWRSEFLAVITDPNIAYVLMLVGIYGLLIEFYNPGIGLPGVVGAVCLLLAMYAFQVLPISYTGMGLIILGIGLMTAEAFAPSFGVLGLGGIVAFVVGSIMLMDTELPGYQIAMPMIAAFAVFSAALLVFALGMILRARRQAVRTGLGHLLGAVATVESVSNGTAWARLDGELWEVACGDTLGPEDRVVVRAIDGLTLQVSKDKGERG
ncbi:MAG: nodulation protein NfeD [Halieaceae bacterium]|nr:nodulation protein NfeD [Halieaceae bacterium]MCP5164398.1 nodulation protein NfeD [Pseudomonadales bacterium]